MEEEEQGAESENSQGISSQTKTERNAGRSTDVAVQLEEDIVNVLGDLWRSRDRCGQNKKWKIIKTKVAGDFNGRKMAKAKHLRNYSLVHWFGLVMRMSIVYVLSVQSHCCCCFCANTCDIIVQVHYI